MGELAGQVAAMQQAMMSRIPDETFFRIPGEIVCIL
jgi:hypothetical protein